MTRKKLAEYVIGLSAGLGAAMMLVALAKAAPPENADPMFAPWFRSLMQPDGSMGCCSQADCRTTAYRVNNGRYEVPIDDKWIAVPEDKILKNTSNPTGKAVVCYLPSLGVLCFVLPAMT